MASSGPHPPLVAATAAAGGAGTGGVDVRSSIFQMLIGKGLTSQQAMGVVYSMMGESGTGLDAGATGDSGNSIGFGQWNGDRRAALEATAKGMGVAATDPSAQLAHFQNEINGPYAAEIERVKNNATTAADATRLWTGSVGEKAGYERPKVNNWQQRYAQGTQAGTLDANNSPVWKTPGTQVASSGATTAPSGASPATGPPTSVGDALKRLTQKDEGDKPSALGNLAEAIQPTKQQQQQAPQAPEMLQAPQDQSAMLAPAAQQLLSQTMAASARPLSWGSSPYGSGTAGQQPPGLTLTGNPYG